MFCKFVFCLLVALACCLGSQSAKRNFNLELRNVSCTPFTDLVRQLECDVRKLAPNRFGFNLMFYLNRPVPLDADLEILLQYRLPHAKRVVPLINLKLKICDVLLHVPTVPMIKEILNGLTRFSNFPLSCPVKGNVMYNVTNLIITDSICPPYAPIVDFNFTLSFYEGKQTLVIYLLEGSTTRKTKT
ncbi:uncharacterized protein LOC106086501 [Stomoxys calcitrans]|uniref:MD-2-related lipid-recognition domain-containing protein n=1 Tax=Stomoxys calcitrans TaxID=35570 RepID=A0A1I8PPT3_STOCA|nr:uncharacterized protein LOC106086501 [Stomoxys calcitrans]